MAIGDSYSLENLVCALLNKPSLQMPTRQEILANYHGERDADREQRTIVEEFLAGWAQETSYSIWETLRRQGYIIEPERGFRSAEEIKREAEREFITSRQEKFISSGMAVEDFLRSKTVE